MRPNQPCRTPTVSVSTPPGTCEGISDNWHGREETAEEHKRKAGGPGPPARPGTTQPFLAPDCNVIDSVRDNFQLSFEHQSRG
jgi:hypothetical protein